jgi:hypothetical protein
LLVRLAGRLTVFRAVACDARCFFAAFREGLGFRPAGRLAAAFLLDLRRGFFTGMTTGGIDGSVDGMMTLSPALMGFGVTAPTTAFPALFNPSVTDSAALETASVVFLSSFLSSSIAVSLSSPIALQSS